jgi:hypothetical protein
MTDISGLIPRPPRCTQLAALRAAFPGYEFSVHITADRKRRYEAVAKYGGNPWCLITTDPREIWSELRAACGSSGNL